jgi:hypothetical protein
MTPASCQAVSTSPWTNAAVIATMLGSLVFVAAYSWRTRGAWRDSAVGQNVMTFMASVLVVSSLAVASIIWGTDWPHRNLIRTLAWGLIAACIWWRVVILFRIQHRDG